MELRWLLGLQNSAVVRRLDDGVCTSHPIVDSLGRKQVVTFVKEDGLYDAILDSRKLVAKEFRYMKLCRTYSALKSGGNPIHRAYAAMLGYAATFGAMVMWECWGSISGSILII